MMPRDPYGTNTFARTFMGCMGMIIAGSLVILVVFFGAIMCAAITN